MHQLKQSSSDQVRSIEERVGCRARPSGRTDTRSKIQNLLQMGGELSTCIFTPVYQPDCSSDLVSLVVCVMLTADRSLSGSGVELHEHNGEGGKRGDRTRVSGGAESSETLNRIQTKKAVGAKSTRMIRWPNWRHLCEAQFCFADEKSIWRDSGRKVHRWGGIFKYLLSLCSVSLVRLPSSLSDSLF